MKWRERRYQSTRQLLQLGGNNVEPVANADGEDVVDGVFTFRDIWIITNDDIPDEPFNHVELPNLEHIDEFAFQGKDFNFDVNAPNLIQIGNLAFENSGLTYISAPLLTQIDDEVFAECASLTRDLAFPNCSEIGDFAFYNSGLTHISAPLLEKIGAYVFSGCASLTGDLAFPNCSEIGKFAFRACRNVKNISIKSARNIDRDAFIECSDLQQVDFGEINGFDSIPELNEEGAFECTGVVKYVFFFRSRFSSGRKSMTIRTRIRWKPNTVGYVQEAVAFNPPLRFVTTDGPLEISGTLDPRPDNQPHTLQTLINSQYPPFGEEETLLLHYKDEEMVNPANITMEILTQRAREQRLSDMINSELDDADAGAASIGFKRSRDHPGAMIAFVDLTQ